LDLDRNLRQVRDSKLDIYFPFDIETDTTLSVATEIIAKLDITDQDVT
jgi:hypothetical protein